MKLYLVILTLVCTFFSACNEPSKIKVVNNSTSDLQKINCTDAMCSGFYNGPEFKLGSDVAHQFSNSMSYKVGDKLKELYDNGKYSKVDFQNISMTTVGMNTGNVEYKLNIPFVRVQSKCEAYTSFDHVGGWNHSPDLKNRIKQLSSVLLEGEKLDISELKRTKEGLQEYWIQWKNKEKQSECIIDVNK